MKIPNTQYTSEPPKYHVCGFKGALPTRHPPKSQPTRPPGSMRLGTPGPRGVFTLSVVVTPRLSSLFASCGDVRAGGPPSGPGLPRATLREGSEIPEVAALRAARRSGPASSGAVGAPPRDLVRVGGRMRSETKFFCGKRCLHHTHEDLEDRHRCHRV